MDFVGCLIFQLELENFNHCLQGAGAKMGKYFEVEYLHDNNYFLATFSYRWKGLSVYFQGHNGLSTVYA